MVTRIGDSQRAQFATWASRLTKLNDEGQEDQVESGLSNLPAGALKSLEILLLDIGIPVGMDILLSMARNLRIIQYVPGFAEMDDDTFVAYNNDFRRMVKMCSNADVLPSLKLVHASLPQALDQGDEQRNEELVSAAWNAARRHGGWKIRVVQPLENRIRIYPRAWDAYWNDLSFDCFITLKGLGRFVNQCTQDEVYPRLDELIDGKIHLQVGTVLPDSAVLLDTVVYGLWANHNEKTDLPSCLHTIVHGVGGDCVTYTISLLKTMVNSLT